MVGDIGDASQQSRAGATHHNIAVRKIVQFNYILMKPSQFLRGSDTMQPTLRDQFARKLALKQPTR